MKVELDDVKCIKDTALTIIGSRRRLTVPSEIVETLKLENGDKLRWILFSNGDVQIRKVK